MFAESAIDALSYATLFPDTTARYASIGGKMNPEQPDLIRATILNLLEGGEVIAATDEDEDRCKLAAQIEVITSEAGLKFKHHEPSKEGSDWNDHLKPELSYHQSLFSYRP